MSDKRQKNQLVLAFLEEGRGEAPNRSQEGTESLTAKRGAESPAIGERLMEEVCERENCKQAPEAWKLASALSAQKDIIYVDKPFLRVLSIMPTLYDDLWTGAKGMYKMEPAIADGGEVVILAPHISEISYTHGRLIDEIGYHCRDYFLAQWDKYKGYPGGVLAHSTHVKGLGQYDASTGKETPRIQVTLATGIPEERCRRVNLGYLDPTRLRRQDWEGREDEGILVVPRAGEMLYRVRRNPAGQALDAA
jgi:lactate racemase